MSAPREEQGAASLRPWRIGTHRQGDHRSGEDRRKGLLDDAYYAWREGAVRERAACDRRQHAYDAHRKLVEAARAVLWTSTGTAVVGDPTDIAEDGLPRGGRAPERALLLALRAALAEVEEVEK